MYRTQCSIIATTMREVLISYYSDIKPDKVAVWQGDYHLLDKVYSQLKEEINWPNYPLNRHKKILAALEKSPLFEKTLFRGCDSRGTSRLMRLFYLKENVWNLRQT